MTYATLDILIDRYGQQLLVQLTDPANAAIVVDVVDRALADADAEIDGRLLGRYALPLAETPPLLVDLAQRIAIYKLHRLSVSTKIEADYKDAMVTLDKIGRGDVRLPLAVAGGEPTGSGASGVVTIDRQRDFTPENMRGFI